jgi:hypothetical protein
MTESEPLAYAYDKVDDELIAKLYTPDLVMEFKYSGWTRVEMCDGYELEQTETGIRYAKSPLTGTYYRVTEWEDRGDGKIVAEQKHEVDRDEVPEVWLAALDERADEFDSLEVSD